MAVARNHDNDTEAYKRDGIEEDIAVRKRVWRLQMRHPGGKSVVVVELLELRDSRFEARLNNLSYSRSGSGNIDSERTRFVPNT